MKNSLELIPKTSPSKFFPGLAFFMSRNMIADSQMNTKNIINTLISFTRTGFSIFWKLTVPMNRAIVHNAACNDGTTFVCIASGVIFSNCVISKCKDSEKTPIIKISMVSHFSSCILITHRIRTVAQWTQRKAIDYWYRQEGNRWSMFKSWVMKWIEAMSYVSSWIL